MNNKQLRLLKKLREIEKDYQEEPDYEELRKLVEDFITKVNKDYNFIMDDYGNVSRICR